MVKRALLSLFLFFFSRGAPVFGQFIKVIDEKAFSAEPIKLDFGAVLEGAKAGDIHFRWGVTFRGQGATVPVIVSRDPCPICLIPPVIITSVANVTPPGSPDQPLTVNFDPPVVRVGFKLFGATKETTVKVFDALGKSLGTVEQQPFPQSRFGDFIGLESTAPQQGIAKVVIDYNVAPPLQTSEQIDELLFEFAEARSFTTFLAQIGHGPLETATATFLQATATGIQTSLILSNPTNLEAKGTLTLFNGEGQPFRLDFEELGPPVPSPGPPTPDPAISFSISPFSSGTFTTTGSPKVPLVGYAQIKSNVPLEVLGVFRTKGSAGTVAEASVAGGSGKLTAIGRIQKVGLGQFDSGIAIVNTSDREATIRLVARESMTRATDRILKLGPRQHLARFLGELFSVGITDFSVFGDFKGTLFVTSTEPVAVIVLRTKNGLAISSLPVASTQP